MPDTGVIGGFGTTHTDPAGTNPATADESGNGNGSSYAGTDRAQAPSTAAPHLATAPERAPSAPSALGGTDGAAGAVPIPTATASPAHTGIAVPGTTTNPQAPNPPAPAPPKATNAPRPDPASPQKPAPGPKPKPTATPDPTTTSPAPDHPDDPGLCLPVIDFCLGGLD
ncbi:hypothetical protein AB0K92_02205 [Streptomyces sp. NPDC052687]|uniref:hypothetical protein n=1 Tax=Streptomyces sp. NPDC052687 TaxID=3154759 RepID=UPI003429CC5F